MPVIHSLHSEAGAVSIDPQLCKQCGQCAAVCPTRVLRLEDRSIGIHPEAIFGCIACGHCMMACPESAISVTGRDLSPADIAPLPSPEQRATADALTALMLSRRSIRHFSSEEIDPAMLDRVVEMAASAPMGIPPWDVGCIIIRGRSRVRDLSNQIVNGYAGFLKIFRPWLLTLMRPFIKRTTYDQFRSFLIPLAHGYVDARAKGEDGLFYDAPAVLIFHHSPYADATDAAIACTYAMLAAESLGLGSTMIGAAAPILQRNKPLCRSLGIPQTSKPAIALILGHPVQSFRHSVRRRFSSVNTVC